MIKKMMSGMLAQKRAERDAELYRNLIRHEAKVGGQLFGLVPEGHRREFFCLDEHTWVWHEEWLDKNGQRQVRTTRYDVRPSGIIKSQNGSYQNVGREEAQRLRDAANLYLSRIKAEVYSFA